MAMLPLLAHDRPDAIVAYRGGEPISAAQFLADTRTLARRLPASTHILNACKDRYHFTVGLGASLLAGKCSVLPSTHTPEVIRHLRSFAPDVFCLSDDPQNSIDLPQLLYTPDATKAQLRSGAGWNVPQIHAERLAAYIFTSGSTGVPLPHRKTWGRLVSCVRAEVSRLTPLQRTPCAIVGTVPPQHMYGFESTVLLPLQSGSALSAERPFYPADIAEMLERLRAPRVLFSTPVHLRALLASDIRLPKLELIVSATAMLSANIAREVEQRFGCELLEIYGSTETGQIATRRTATEVRWRLWPDVRLQVSDSGAAAYGGHVGQPTPLADVVEITDPQHFLLHGRTADLVNIAGKRNSVSYLNHQLNAIPGVLDGAFFVREDTDESIAGSGRLAAVVVAPGLTASAITQALRERIDPVFLPRPLLLVEQLPRNETGKLPQHTLREIAAEAAVAQPHLFV
ncbi:MAG TPA: AMP-binding protein [Steroidobacteraceae bacterium]|jgi:acyl-coenzyme A synthetase/AMP-(fatty) acid ligase|nr:AMP-binding protein [Steroidobacteraceae bacterium]